MRAKDLKVGDRVSYIPDRYSRPLEVEIIEVPVIGIATSEWGHQYSTDRRDSALVRPVDPDARIPIRALRQRREGTVAEGLVVPLRLLKEPWATHVAQQEEQRRHEAEQRARRAAVEAAWDAEVNALVRCTPLTKEDVTCRGPGQVSIRCDLPTFRALVAQMERGQDELDGYDPTAP